MEKEYRESDLMKSLKEAELEKYSFYKKYDLVYIVLKLMTAFEQQRYVPVSKLESDIIDIAAENPTTDTKKVKIDTSLLNYIDLKYDYDLDDFTSLYGFGPRESRFNLNLPKDESLDYIQDFADVLYEYRRKNSLINLSQKELEELVKRYISISKDEIAIRNGQPSKKKNIKK